MPRRRGTQQARAAREAVLPPASRRAATRAVPATARALPPRSACPHDGQKRAPEWSGVPQRAQRTPAAAAGRSRGEEPVDLADALLERDDLGRLLVEDVLAEVVLPVHLEDEAAEVADALLAVAEQRRRSRRSSPGGGGR